MTARGFGSNWADRIRIAGTALSLGLLIWLLLQQDWQQLYQFSKAVSPLWLAAALGLILFRMLAHTYRWLVLLKAQGTILPYRTGVRIQFAGLFASNFLPTTVGGDAARFLGVVPLVGSRLVSAASLLVDRAIGVIGMLFVLPLGLPLLQALILDGGGLLGMSAAYPGRLLGAFGGALGRLREAFSLWLKDPKSLLLALLASWVGIFCYILSVWLVARELQIAVRLDQVAGATAITYFLTLIPIAINAYGIRELGVLALYTQLGASVEQATALALITRGLQILASTPGAFFLGGLISSSKRTEAESEHA